jgi:hypothetical protein
MNSIVTTDRLRESSEISFPTDGICSRIAGEGGASNRVDEFLAMNQVRAFDIQDPFE